MSATGARWLLSLRKVAGAWQTIGASTSARRAASTGSSISTRPSGVSHAASAKPATSTGRRPPLRGCGLRRSDIFVLGLFACPVIAQSSAQRNRWRSGAASRSPAGPKIGPDRPGVSYNDGTQRLERMTRTCGPIIYRREGDPMGWRAPVPANEAERLAAVKSYQLIDTAPEIAYDEITELAAQICQCPVAVIGLIDESRDWKKSAYGFPPDMCTSPREMSIC